MPGQTPGPPVPEHNVRVQKTTELWNYFYSRGITADIILTSGLPDRNGLTGARWMKAQFTAKADVSFTKSVAIHLKEHLVIGEEESAHTAQSFLLLGDSLYRKDGSGRRHPLYDAVGIVTNTPHLHIARIYGHRFLRGIHIVGVSSGDGHGALNMEYGAYRNREALLRLVARVDLNGKLLEWTHRSYFARLRADSLQLEWPAAPSPKSV